MRCGKKRQPARRALHPDVFGVEAARDSRIRRPFDNRPPVRKDRELETVDMRPHQKLIHLDISHGRHLRRERLQIDGRASLGNLHRVAAAKDDRLSLATFQIA